MRLLKKYVLEDYLEKIKNLTPIQSTRNLDKRFRKNSNQNFRILNETKISP